MRISIILGLGCLLLSATLVLPQQNETEAIKSVLVQQVDCWNRADLDCFMEGYWKSDSLVFIGSSGPRYGWQTTLDNYRKSSPDKASMGQLEFDIISIDLLGKENAFVVGKWHLKRTIGDVSGHFTLLWKKIDGDWVIVKDHSS